MKQENIDSKRKSTFATTYRGDIRTIATLALFWRDRGEVVKSANGVLRLSIEGLKELVVDKNPEYEVGTTTMAVRILEEFGIIDMEKDRKNKPTLIGELSMESLMLEGIPVTEKFKKMTKKEQKVLGPFTSQQ